MNLVKTIRSAVDSDSVIFGSKKTIDQVLNGKAKLVVVASNCELNSKEEVTRFSKLSGIEIQEFEGSSVELGAVCGKPFVISMLAVIEQKEEKKKSKRKK